MMDELVKDLKKHLEDATFRDEHFSKQPFVPLGEIERVLSYGALKNLLRARLSLNDIQLDDARVEIAVKEIFAQPTPTAERKYLKVFGILIYSFNTRGLKKLIDYLLDREPSWIPPMDDALPIEKEAAEDYFGDRYGSYFYEWQLKFCAKVLREDEENNVNPTWPLPFIGELGTALGKGSSGTVYKVKIAKRHWMKRDGGCDYSLSNDKDIELAYKVFAMDDKDFENEVAIFNTLREKPTISKHINFPIGTLIVGSIRSLLYPLATMDLGQFFSDRGACSPSLWSPTRRTEVLDNATELVGALYWLHGPHYDDDSVIHLDIRPQNIFIFRDNTWKLADFNLSRIKIRRHRDAGDNSSINYALEYSPTSITHSASYSAPEDQGGIAAGHKSDVYSIGCMLVMILSYMYDDGPQGVSRLLERRKEHWPKRRRDYFYKEKILEGEKSVVNPGVEKQCNQLVDNARNMSVWDGDYVKKLTTHLLANIFVAESYRERAELLYQYMKRSLKDYCDASPGKQSSSKEPLVRRIPAQGPISRSVSSAAEPRIISRCAASARPYSDFSGVNELSRSYSTQLMGPPTATSTMARTSRRDLPSTANGESSSSKSINLLDELAGSSNVSAVPSNIPQDPSNEPARSPEGHVSHKQHPINTLSTAPVIRRPPRIIITRVNSDAFESAATVDDPGRGCTQTCLVTCSPLCDAITRADRDAFESAASAEVVNDLCKGCNRTPIYTAIIRRKFLAELLEVSGIQKERPIDPVSGCLITPVPTHAPLMECCNRGYFEGAQMLLKAGARFDEDDWPRMKLSSTFKKKMKPLMSRNVLRPHCFGSFSRHVLVR